MLINKTTLFLRFLFGLIAVLFCAILSFRPIPSIYDPNDTGRYVSMFHQACNMPVSFDWGGNISHESFNILTFPVCGMGEDRFFLFLTSVIVPLTLLFWGRWTRGGMLVGLSLILSVIGFELMTNALRQGASLFFLVGAFALNKHKVWQLIAVVLAMFLHDSSWVFLPLLLAISYEKYHLWKLQSRFTAFILLMIILLPYLLALRYVGQFDDTDSAIEFYSISYENALTVAFLIFFILPVYWVFAVRMVVSEFGVSMGEKAMLIYSSLVIIITVLFFPNITYRFAMTSMVLQLFMAMVAVDRSVKIGVWIFAGLVIHFAIFSVVSPNVWNVLNG